LTFLFVACPSILDVICAEKYAAVFEAHNYLLTFKLNGRLPEMQKKRRCISHMCIIWTPSITLPIWRVLVGEKSCL